MSKISNQAAEAFADNKNFSKSNRQIVVDGNSTFYYLYDNLIAVKTYTKVDEFHRNVTLHIDTCGWATKTTKESLNAINGVSINTAKSLIFLNGEVWDGRLISVV